LPLISVSSVDSVVHFHASARVVSESILAMAENDITTVNTRLSAVDGHTLAAYVAEPDNPGAAVVVLQEIYGVNQHVRAVAEAFAREGFYAIAPSLFDRITPEVELEYNAEGAKRGMEIARALGVDAPMEDIEAAIERSHARIASDRVGVVGFCWGGTLAWLSAARLDCAAAVCYYGGLIPAYADETPQHPVLLHFGKRDQHIPAADIERIRSLQPRVPIHMYDAGHGFNCSERADYHADASKLAWTRTIEFLREHLLGARQNKSRVA
jgi:carboxymethylenebutenolidase